MARAPWYSTTALVLVIAGGAVGVAARAAITLPIPTDAHPLLVPAVTLGENLLGAFLLGLVVGIVDDRFPRARLFFGTGMLGGFTTYSAFAVHAVTVSSASPPLGLVLIVLSLIGGVFAAALGLVLGRRIAGVPNEIEQPEDAE